MTWQRFLIAIVIGVGFGTCLVLIFGRWPDLASSPWAMLVLFLLAIVFSRVMRRFLRR